MGVLTMYLASFTFIAQDHYGASSGVFALLIGGNALALVVSSQVNAHLVVRVGPVVLVALVTKTLTAGPVGAVGASSLLQPAMGRITSRSAQRFMRLVLRGEAGLRR